MISNYSGSLTGVYIGISETKNANGCIRRETEEETRFNVNVVKKIFRAYMAPVSVKEILHFHLAEYIHDMKDDEGNGNAYAEENIEVTEPDFEKVFKINESGKIKSGKTIALFYYIKLHNLMDNTLMQDFM